MLLSSTVKVSGCSGNVFNVSIRSFEGIATEPLLELSTSIDDIIVVSRSLEVIFNLEPSKSNKKWSKTGIVFEVFSGKKEIARGGRYDDLLKSLGAKRNTPAVGAAINLKNI